MPVFTALATKVYKDGIHVQWANSIQANDNYLVTGISKGWVEFDGSTSTVTSNANFNVTNIVDNALGDWTITWTTGFTNSSYAVFLNARDSATTVINCVLDATGASGGAEIAGASARIAALDTSNVRRDAKYVSVCAMGASA